MIIIVMGVSGCGKTTIGRHLAHHLGVAFIEGDDLHPKANIAKMSRGQPLTDDDRWPWLDALRHDIVDHLDQGLTAVYSCSALKQAYRRRLAQGDPAIHFVHLDANFETIHARLTTRGDHFMPAELLASQFDTLETPAAHEDIPRFEAGQAIEDTVSAILKWLRER